MVHYAMHFVIVELITCGSYGYSISPPTSLPTSVDDIWIELNELNWIELN